MEIANYNAIIITRIYYYEKDPGLTLPRGQQLIRIASETTKNKHIYSAYDSASTRPTSKRHDTDWMTEQYAQAHLSAGFNTYFGSY